MKRFCLSIRDKTTNCTATVDELIARRYLSGSDAFVLSESAMSANNLVNIGAENTIEFGTEGTIALTEYGASDGTFILQSKATATRIMNQGVEDIVFTLSESEAETSRVRLRYLSDMDDLNLSDLDLMTVLDLDYITID